ncbi:MAG: nicotinate (nicotinamide) nucleotide adenylyltransferase [Lachnospiraceae bacterium]|nr:nicotinate (nicotinamide) nucleotide adenylyltransferase [Lachnospiraceae bacterium]
MVERKIGILGGTFDPVHLAHLQLAKCAYEQFELETVIFLPAGDPPHKTDRPVTPAYRRLEMLKLCLKDYPFFSLSEYEIEKQGYSYTAETLEYFTQMHPEVQFYFIIGADSLFALDTWYAPERCLDKAVFLVGNRLKREEEEIDRQIVYLTGRYGGLIEKIEMPAMEISSSSIRELLSEGQDASLYLSPAVCDYIQKNRLYYKGPAENLTMAIKHRLSAGRFLHTLGVEETAQGLANKYGADAERARIAALLHDIAKPLDTKEILRICEEGGDPIREEERACEKVLHARAGAVIAEKEFGVTDPEILNAIRFHTTGRPEMSLLEKIIFIADYIEPGRSKAPNLDKIRREAALDLNRCVCMIARDTLQHLREIGSHVDKKTEETYEYYHSLTNVI